MLWQVEDCSIVFLCKLKSSRPAVAFENKSYELSLKQLNYKFYIHIRSLVDRSAHIASKERKVTEMPARPQETPLQKDLQRT
jgi:hypothetical protein